MPNGLNIRNIAEPRDPLVKQSQTVQALLFMMLRTSAYPFSQSKTNSPDELNKILNNPDRNFGLIIRSIYGSLARLDNRRFC